MNDCFENIVGIKPNCEVGSGVEPVSGYYIQDYVGINIKSAANIADGDMLTGLQYLTDLRRRAFIRLQNDILRYINSTFKVNNISSVPWSTTKAVRSSNIGAITESDKRGIVLEKKNTNCRLQSIFISKVIIHSASSNSTILKIANATTNEVTSFPIDLEANIDNEFIINRSFKGNEIQIYLPGNTEVKSVDPHCNCGGQSSSDCINVKGMFNTSLSKSEAYGITAEVQCKCDYSDLLCDLSMDQLLGQAAFELMGAMFYDERAKSTRFNWMTIYNTEEIKEQSQAGFAMYSQYFLSSMEGVKPYIESAGPCGCIDCRGIKVKDNI